MWRLFVGAAIAAIGGGLILWRKDEIDAVAGWFFTLIAGIMMLSSAFPKQAGQYYLPAEIVAQNPYYTYFASEDGNIFASAIRPWHDMNSPYLLCMDTMGTTHVEDDEILVVWRTE